MEPVGDLLRPGAPCRAPSAYAPRDPAEYARRRGAAATRWPNSRLCDRGGDRSADGAPGRPGSCHTADRAERPIHRHRARGASLRAARPYSARAAAISTDWSAHRPTRPNVHRLRLPPLRRSARVQPWRLRSDAHSGPGRSPRRIAPRAGWARTAEAADGGPQAHDASPPGQIQRPTSIAVVDVLTGRTAGGAMTDGCGALHFQANHAAIETHQNNVERRGNQGGVHRAPLHRGYPITIRRHPAAPQQARESPRVVKHKLCCDTPCNSPAPAAPFTVAGSPVPCLPR